MQDGEDHQILATVHSSSILRAPEESKASERAHFIEDLRVARSLL